MENAYKYNSILEDEDLLDDDQLIGLTDKEVKDRIRRGETNKIPKAPSRTLLQIIRANFFNVFSGINAALGLLVILSGSPKNAVFALVIIVNSLIGVIQELNAKKTLEKLSVLSMAHAKVLRNGKIIDVSIEELVKDDVVYLATGQQILADCEIINSDELEVDESMLTGEEDSVHKKESDKLLSGSFIVAGEGYARVTNVGKATYTSKLSDEARRFKIVNSELQTSINKIIKLMLWAIIPIGILLTITQLLYTGIDWRGAVIGTVSGVSGMIPEGLVLLTSTTFIVSIVKLSKYNTLVQQLSATENLARVDVLCLDKTGTITEGRLELEEVIPLKNRSKEQIDLAIAAIANNLPSKNPTQQALMEFYKEDPGIKVVKKVPFSSKRKWGGITLSGHGSWVIGAPEILLKDRYKDIQEIVEKEAQKGKRVLLLGRAETIILEDTGDFKVNEVALILMNDVIRKEAPSVLEYFKEEGVDIKVISGDNPVTVSRIAKRAGVDGAERYIDAKELPKEIDKLKEVVNDYTVFGRVTPHQKKDIVMALKQNGSTVGMTGDGVNDVLALKEADCGIAMASGSDVARAVAQLVLLDSDFSSLTKVVSEGRKQIHNLELVAQLFLSKTVFFVIIALVFCIARLPYPVLPIQTSLIGSCAIGLPALFLAMLPYKGRVESNFLRRILKECIPNGIIMVIFTTISYMIAYNAGMSIEHCRTVSMLTMAGLSFGILFKVSRPLNGIKVASIGAMLGVVILSYILPLGRKIFSLTKISLLEIAMVGCFTVLGGFIMLALSSSKKNRQITKVISKVKRKFKKYHMES